MTLLEHYRQAPLSERVEVFGEMYSCPEIYAAIKDDSEWYHKYVLDRIGSIGVELVTLADVQPEDGN
jgi:hypothetical protein